MEIEIPRELAEAEAVPEDLDANVVGPYRFPSPRRRRAAAAVYAGAALLAALGAVTVLPGRMWIAAAGLLVLAGYHAAAAHVVTIDEHAALAAGGRMIEFPVGHASAALRFEGWRARPVWNVLLYDAAEPPARRALILIDATDGSPRRDPYVETLAGP